MSDHAGSDGEQAEGLVELREFGTLTVDLLALSAWLTAAGITHVAMESTGESWKPVFNLLEGNVQVVLVNAAHLTQVPGRKTDKADARWLAKLMRHGLLQVSFIPSPGQRDLRDLTRYRTKLVQERGREVNRVQGVLERANIKLAAVANDIMGVSGRVILAVLIAGRTDPATKAALAKGRLRSTILLLEQALTGLVRDLHRRMLAIQLAHIDFLDEQIEVLSAEITHCLAVLSAGDTPPLGNEVSAGGVPATAPNLSVAPVTFMRAIALLDTIPGVDQRGGCPSECRRLCGAAIGDPRPHLLGAVPFAGHAVGSCGQDSARVRVPRLLSSAGSVPPGAMALYPRLAQCRAAQCTL